MTSSENKPIPTESESPEYRNEPMTFAERLDAAQTGEEFGAVISRLFDTLDATRHRGPGATDEESE